MANAQDFIKAARSQVGYKENPANSNRTKYGEWYGMNGQPWCDIFIAWCANQANALGIVGKFAYTPNHADWFKKRGQWLDREAKPQPGDVVFFSNSTRICHVGIVTARNGTVSVSTIEGNTSAGSNANGGQVQERVRTYGKKGSSWWIAGFGRPAWTAEQHPGNSGSTSPLLDVDGKWGKDTTQATQRALGTAVDGYVDGQRTVYKKNLPACLSSSWRFGKKGSSPMVKALQRVIGADPDGVAGPEFARKFRAWLGLSVREVVDADTVRAWQRRLNGGWKL